MSFRLPAFLVSFVVLTVAGVALLNSPLLTNSIRDREERISELRQPVADLYAATDPKWTPANDESDPGDNTGCAPTESVATDTASDAPNSDAPNSDDPERQNPAVPGLRQDPGSRHPEKPTTEISNVPPTDADPAPGTPSHSDPTRQDPPVDPPAIREVEVPFVFVASVTLQDRVEAWFYDGESGQHVIAESGDVVDLGSVSATIGRIGSTFVVIEQGEKTHCIQLGNELGTLRVEPMPPDTD